MKQQIMLFLLLAVSITAAADSDNNTTSTSRHQNQPRQFEQLGISDGFGGSKLMYATLRDNQGVQPTYTWQEAKRFCEEAGTNIRIASVLEIDYAFLTRADIRPRLGAATIYWTSGRDAQAWTLGGECGQFRWDDDGDRVAQAVYDPSPWGFYRVGYKTCVSFMILIDGIGGRLAGMDCQNKYPVLCQGPFPPQI